MGAYVFGRGSNVLEYWLARAEGFGVRARGSRVGVVEDVVLDPARGTASALVLSSRFLHRRRVVLARTVEAVDPEARVFELEVEERARSRLGSRGSSAGRRRACTHSLWRPGGS